MTRFKTPLLIIGGVALVVLVAFGIHCIPKQPQPANGFSYLDARASDAAPKSLYPLHQKLEAYLANAGPQPSFYFQDLSNGRAIKFGDNIQAPGMSLVKVPIVMNLYHAAEKHAIDLDKPVTITAAELNHEYGTLWKRGAGTTITLREAADYALVQSDNTAILVIDHHIQGLVPEDENSTLAVDAHADLEQNLGTLMMSAREYSAYLRCLYYACYLSKQHSTELLSMLSKSESHDASKYLPAGVTMAHKIGVVTGIGMSDCGIVYVPEHPYIQCIMLQEEHPKAKEDIANISKMIYEYMTEQ